MRVLVAIASFLLIVVVLWDAFETIVLPRRVTRRLRLTSFYYRVTWQPWLMLTRLIRSHKRREMSLSIYGPLSLLALIALWAVGLVFGFGMLNWATGTPLNIPPQAATFSTYLYMSGVVFFTLGFGDVTPVDGLGRLLTVLQSGMGFGVLAIVIGYLPVLYGAFSRREINVALLDARAGSPPSAVELLCRHAHAECLDNLEGLLADWERWSAELLESHLSYPVLSYYRSQHNNQSWLAALVVILDACALVLTTLSGTTGRSRWQAQLTFTMSRHALVDIVQVFDAASEFKRLREHGDAIKDRLPASALDALQRTLEAGSIPVERTASSEHHLAELRASYEPFAVALADYLLMPLPVWNPDTKHSDNWQTSKWTRPVARDAVLDSAYENRDGATPEQTGDASTEEHAW